MIYHDCYYAQFSVPPALMLCLPSMWTRLFSSVDLCASEVLDITLWHEYLTVPQGLGAVTGLQGVKSWSGPSWPSGHLLSSFLQVFLTSSALGTLS